MCICYPCAPRRLAPAAHPTPFDSWLAGREFGRGPNVQPSPFPFRAMYPWSILDKRYSPTRESNYIPIHACIHPPTHNLSISRFNTTINVAREGAIGWRDSHLVVAAVGLAVAVLSALLIQEPEREFPASAEKGTSVVAASKTGGKDGGDKMVALPGLGEGEESEERESFREALGIVFQSNTVKLVSTACARRVVIRSDNNSPGFCGRSSGRRCIPANVSCVRGQSFLVCGIGRASLHPCCPCCGNSRPVCGIVLVFFVPYVYECFPASLLRFAQGVCTRCPTRTAAIA